jgi:predicted outer membrane repeat protein
MRIKQLVTISALLAAFLLPSPAHAGGVVTVCDESHLLAALDGGGAVTFACSGTITLSDTITIDDDTTIDGSGQDITISGNSAVRVFTVVVGATLNLHRLTVANGHAENGGGVFIPRCFADCGDTEVVVINSTLSGNSASSHGGGIFASNYCFENCGYLTVTVHDSTFSGNSAGGSGGAIYHDGDYTTQYTTVKVSNSTFKDNAAGSGGAIFSGNQTELTVSDSTFSGNDRDGIGTAVYGYARLSVSHSAFFGNNGDGIHNVKWNSLTVSNSAFSGNSGCGIDSYDAQLAVSNSTFTDNGDCGLSNGDDNGEATVTGCTFTNNGGTGGDIHNAFMGTTTVANSTFANPSANHKGGIRNGVEGRLTVINSTLAGVPIINSDYGGALTLKNTIVAGSLPGGLCSGTIVDGGGNLSYPDTSCPGVRADPRLGPLQDNGGPTLTMEPGPGSAAIDAGDDVVCAAAPVGGLDQRGGIRPVGPHCDIGAVEVDYLPWRQWLPIIFAR